jgi:hypothetical protein
MCSNRQPEGQAVPRPTSEKNRNDHIDLNSAELSLELRMECWLHTHSLILLYGFKSLYR